MQDMPRTARHRREAAEEYSKLERELEAQEKLRRLLPEAATQDRRDAEALSESKRADMADLLPLTRATLTCAACGRTEDHDVASSRNWTYSTLKFLTEVIYCPAESANAAHFDRTLKEALAKHAAAIIRAEAKAEAARRGETP